MTTGIEALLGVALLAAGRRIFWLFVAGVGFVIGLSLASQLLPDQSDAVRLVIALAVALMGAAAAVFAQKVAIGVVGFLGGGWLALRLLSLLSLHLDDVAWLVFIVAGILGVLLLSRLFEWGLVLLSALVGAVLLVDALGRIWPASADLAFILLLAAFGIGVLIQARSLA